MIELPLHYMILHALQREVERWLNYLMPSCWHFVTARNGAFQLSAPLQGSFHQFCLWKLTLNFAKTTKSSHQNLYNKILSSNTFTKAKATELLGDPNCFEPHPLSIKDCGYSNYICPEFKEKKGTYTILSFLMFPYHWILLNMVSQLTGITKALLLKICATAASTSCPSKSVDFTAQTSRAEA